MSSTQDRAADVTRRAIVLLVLSAAFASGCATTAGMGRGHRAEQAQDYDRAVVEYTNVVRANPANVGARAALERAKLRASQEHAIRGRGSRGLERYEEAVVEYQLAAELNPTDALVDQALKDVRHKLRTKGGGDARGRTELESLIDRTRNLPRPGSSCPKA